MDTKNELQYKYEKISLSKSHQCDKCNANRYVLYLFKNRLVCSKCLKQLLRNTK